MRSLTLKNDITSGMEAKNMNELAMEAGQLLRNYFIYRPLLWHVGISYGASWNPQVSEITEVRGQSWLLHHKLEAAQ